MLSFAQVKTALSITKPLFPRRQLTLTLLHIPESARIETDVGSALWALQYDS